MREYALVKISIGCLILLAGVFHLPLNFEIESTISSIAYIIVGIFIILGTGRINGWFLRMSKSFSHIKIISMKQRDND